MKTALSFASILCVFALAQGCAMNQGSDSAEETNASADALRAAPSDAVIEAKLAQLIAGASFTSEADYPYVVIEGEGGPAVATLTEATIRTRLAAAVKAASEDHRDIKLAAVRAEALAKIDAEIASNIADSHDTSTEEDPYRIHARKLAATLKYMKANLNSPVGFTFGTNASGDGDGEGNVLYIWVGVSKTTGKLIAIMTEAVYT